MADTVRKSRAAQSTKTQVVALVTVLALLGYIDYALSDSRNRPVPAVSPAFVVWSFFAAILAVLTIIVVWKLFCAISPTGSNAVRSFVWPYGFKARRFIFEHVLAAKVVAIITGLISAYNGVEALFGKTSAAFSEHPNFHLYVKVILVTTLLLVGVGTFFKERAKERSLAETEVLLTDFVEMVANIVQHKISRLAGEAKTVPPSRRVDHVTHPTDQLRHIFTESARFLVKTFALRADQIDLTILERKNADSWTFLGKHQNWNHGSPAQLFDNEACASTASKVIQSGEHVFHASKKLAAADGEYHLSRRDEENEDGSIYCAPVFVVCRGTSWQFVVSIVTYGKNLCDPHDEANEHKTMGLLREIVRRVELELHLRAIKDT
jgi:hypothetical protein